MQLGAKETENERFSHYFTKTYRKTASLIANSLKAVSYLLLFDTFFWQSCEDQWSTCLELWRFLTLQIYSPSTGRSSIRRRRPSRWNRFPIWQKSRLSFSICRRSFGFRVIVRDDGKTSSRRFKVRTGHCTCFIRLRKGTNYYNLSSLRNAKHIATWFPIASVHCFR